MLILALRGSRLDTWVSQARCCLQNSVTADAEAHEGNLMLSANLTAEDNLIHLKRVVFLDDLKRSVPASTTV